MAIRLEDGMRLEHLFFWTTRQRTAYDDTQIQIPSLKLISIYCMRCTAWVKVNYLSREQWFITRD